MTRKSASLLEALGQSKLYNDYERAFSEATGLPLSLLSSDMIHISRDCGQEKNPFCALMAKTNETCATCRAVQCRLEHDAGLQPRTLKCFAGLCEIAVPVRVGTDLVAFLHTGQVLLQKPNKKLFSKIAQTLIAWGAEVDLKRAEETWFSTRVLPEQQYDGLVRLLGIFARHLEACANALVIQQNVTAPPSIQHAKAFIVKHCDEDISLSEVARVVNMSAHYLSDKFREITGVTFTEYVTRVRIEKARNLLQNPNLRVSEVAYDVGFHSLSQFNRAFRQFVGKAPTEYRRQNAAA